MRNHGLDPPPMPSEKDDALRKMLGSLGLRSLLEDPYVQSDVLPAEQLPNGAANLESQAANVALQAPDRPLTAENPSGTSEMAIQEPYMFNQADLTGDLSLWLSQTNDDSTVADPASTSTFPEGSEEFFPEGFPGSNSCSLSDNPVHSGFPNVNQADDAFQTERSSSHESLVDELSHRVGTLTIAPAGRIKLCGPSTIMRNTRENAPDDPQGQTLVSKGPHLRWDGELGSSVPEQLQARLEDLYFEFENPFSDIIDREIYENSKQRYSTGEDSSWFSEALRNAM